MDKPSIVGAALRREKIDPNFVLSFSRDKPAPTLRPPDPLPRPKADYRVVQLRQLPQKSAKGAKKTKSPGVFFFGALWVFLGQS
jgi:hypothetical protein